MRTGLQRDDPIFWRRDSPRRMSCIDNQWSDLDDSSIVEFRMIRQDEDTIGCRKGFLRRLYGLQRKPIEDDDGDAGICVRDVGAPLSEPAQDLEGW